MANIDVASRGVVNKFITNKPTTLTNSTGAAITYRMTPASDKDMQTLADEGVVTIAPGWLVEIFDTPVEAVELKTTVSYADTDFEDVEAAVNTVDKYLGLRLWDTTTDAPVYAAGPADDDVWVDAAGTTVYTPV
jgi:hypothetical protein